MAYGMRMFLTFMVIISASLTYFPSAMGATLEKGWHLLSSRCEIDLASQTLTNVASVWKWEDGTWAVYLPSGGTSNYAAQKNFKILSKISPGEGFWVNAIGTVMIPECSSSIVEDGVLSISKEWNLKGIRSSNKVYVDQLFNNSNLFKSVWSWSTLKQSWKVFLPGQDTNAYATQKGFEVLEEIKADEGFWVNANSSVTLDTSEGFLKEEEVPKVLGSTYLLLDSSSSLSESSLGANELVKGSAGLSKSTLGTSWKGPLCPLLDWVLQNYMEGIGGLYASMSMSVPCEQGGSLDVQAKWDGPQQPSSVYDISNLSMTVSALGCKFYDMSISGKITYYIPGIYGYATSAQVSMEKVTIVVSYQSETITTFVPKIQINYSDMNYTYSGLSFKAQLNGEIVAQLGNGKPTLIKYNNFQMNSTLSNSGSGYSSFEGKILTEDTNGWLTVNTKAPVSFNSSGDILSGTIELSFRGNSIIINVSNGLYYVYFNQNFLGTYTENDLKITLK